MMQSGRRAAVESGQPPLLGGVGADSRSLVPVGTVSGWAEASPSGTERCLPGWLGPSYEHCKTFQVLSQVLRGIVEMGASLDRIPNFSLGRFRDVTRGT